MRKTFEVDGFLSSDDERALKIINKSFGNMPEFMKGYLLGMIEAYEKGEKNGI